MGWKEQLSEASAERTLSRARSAVNKGTIYKSPGDHLGRDSDPEGPIPARLDCSGFICWAIGMPRKIGNSWFSSDEIWAHGSPGIPGLFPTHSSPSVGDLLVYPDYTSGGRRHDGHVAIISQVTSAGATKMIHCSLGNYRNNGDAILETPKSAVSWRANTRLVSVDYDVLRARHGIQMGGRRRRLVLSFAAGAGSQPRTATLATAKLNSSGRFVADRSELEAFLGQSLGGPDTVVVTDCLRANGFTFQADLSQFNRAVDPVAILSISALPSF